MRADDYSRDRGLWRPHDLLWITLQALDPAVPPWVRAAVAAGAPVVVRRAPRQGACLPVGVRGASRGQRYATAIIGAQVLRCTTPESLRVARAARVPAMAAIAGLAAALDPLHCPWGITGAVGYELATGTPVCHVDSDLDVVMRCPGRLDRPAAGALQRSLAELAVRCDVQLETPLGAVALADWAGDAERVLVKSDAGPFLSRDPWAGERSQSIDPCAAVAPSHARRG